MSEQMTTRERTSTGAGTEVRGRSSASLGRRDFDETKPSFMTTELWMTLAGIAALIVVYNVADEPSLDLFRTALLCTLAGMAYVVSRGLAKAGAYRVQRDRDDSYR
jgi:hypothetical protein